MLLAPCSGTRRDTSLGVLLHDAFHAAGRLRDAQLCARALTKLARTTPQAARLAADQYQREARLTRHLRRELQIVRPGSLADVIAGWLQPSRGDPDDVLSRRATTRLRVAATRLASGARNGISTAAHSLHRRRIRVKALRYMAEFAAAAGCKLPRSLSLPRLAAQQRALGVVSDLDVQSRRITRFAADHPGWRPTVRQLLGELRHRRTVALDRLGIGTYFPARASGA